jgi:hypothetical protein
MGKTSLFVKNLEEGRVREPPQKMTIRKIDKPMAYVTGSNKEPNSF